MAQLVACPQCGKKWPDLAATAFLGACPHCLLKETFDEIAVPVAASTPMPASDCTLVFRAIQSGTDLVEVARDCHILSPAQVDAFTHDGIPADSRAAAAELLRLGWLTPYQANQLFLNRAPDLVLGSYLVLERLGEGGMGQVFKARHVRMQRVAALKLLRPELLADAEAVARFYREIEVISQLDHPHIVHAYDAGPCNGSHFLAMAHIEGINLARLVKEFGPLSVARACDYVRQAGCGLAYAHQRGLVHRDIKPGNLMLASGASDRPGSTPGALQPPLAGGLVKILDLGLARLRPRPTEQTVAERPSSLTPQGAVMLGTVDYQAPEQALDFHTADIRADLYSLGCTLFYLLTGEPPYAGGTLVQKLWQHQQGALPAIRERRPEVPPAVEAILNRLLAKRPEDRYQTPEELVHALESLDPKIMPRSEPRIASPAAVRVSPVLPATKKIVLSPVPPVRRRRRWRLAVLGCAGVAGLLVLIIHFASQSSPPSPPQPGAASKPTGAASPPSVVRGWYRPNPLTGPHRELEVQARIDRPRLDDSHTVVSVYGEFLFASTSKGRIDIYRRNVKTGALTPTPLSSLEITGLFPIPLPAAMVLATPVLTDQNILYIAPYWFNVADKTGKLGFCWYRFDPKTGVADFLGKEPSWEGGVLQATSYGDRLLLSNPLSHVLQLIHLDPTTGAPSLGRSLTGDGLGGNPKVLHSGAPGVVTSPDSKFLYSTSGPVVGTVRVEEDGTLRHVGMRLAGVRFQEKMKPIPRRIRSLAITPDGQWMYVACWDYDQEGMLALLKRDVPSGALSFVQELPVVVAEMKRINQLEFCGDGQTGLFASGDPGGGLGWFVRDPNSGKLALGGMSRLGGSSAGSRLCFGFAPDFRTVYAPHGYGVKQLGVFGVR